MPDKLPPHSIESEQGVLGCILLSPNECLAECAEKNLSNDAFYDLRHQVIFQHMSSLFAENITVDAITLQKTLRDAGVLEQVGGNSYLTTLADSSPSAANLSYYLDFIVEKHTLRKIIQATTVATQKAYSCSSDVEGLLDSIERDILAIRPNQKNETDIKALVRQATNKIEDRCTNPDTLSGLPTGLRDLDSLTDGLHDGEMIVVAGFPSCGKTALAVNIAVSSAIAGIPSVIFSAEMRPVQLVVRSICSESRVNFYKVCFNDVPAMTVSAKRISTAPLHIEQANRLTIGQVCAIARRLKQKHGIRLAVVDYIQLLTGTGDNREQEISSISKGIKAMALELGIPVLALSQLTDDGKLRESRAIGQDADSIWKLENDGDWQPAVQPIKLNVEKCRDGATGKVNLVFKKTITRFCDASKVSDADVPYADK